MSLGSLHGFVAPNLLHQSIHTLSKVTGTSAPERLPAPISKMSISIIERLCHVNDASLLCVDLNHLNKRRQKKRKQKEDAKVLGGQLVKSLQMKAKELSPFSSFSD